MARINDSRLRNLEARSMALTQVEKNVITLKSQVGRLEKELDRVRKLGFEHAFDLGQWKIKYYNLKHKTENP